MTAREVRGRRLARYEIIAEIASGGMGVVLLARTAGAGGFQRLFAVKVMHPHLVEDTQFVSMLLDEARVAARIHHPNVVPTVDISQHGNLHFLVMDYVESFQLGELLSHPTFSPPDRLRIANRILLDAMSGLEAAHNMQSDEGHPLGIVHRDVSPQNILVGVDGVGRLTDFGIAFALSRITASRPGIIKGKPAYMAPEQALGNHVDRRADIWALGVMLWEAMTGKRLFVADTDVGTILKVINEPIPLPRSIIQELPAELEAVCMRALTRDPAQRYATTREMAAELGRAASYRNLLVDAHAMPEWINAAFGPAIAARRAEIREHIAAFDPEAAPMSTNDVYHLPRLSDSLARARPSAMASPPAGTSPPPRVSPPPSTSTSPPPGSAGGVAVASGKLPVESVAPVAQRSITRSEAVPPPAQPPRDETPLSSSRRASEKKSKPRSSVLLLGILVLLGGVALFAAGRQTGPSVASRPGPASMPGPSQATAVAPPRETPAVTSPTTAPEVIPTKSGVIPSLPAAATPRTVVPSAPLRRWPAPAAAPAAPMPPRALVGAKNPAAGGRAVPIEENPYSLH